MSGRPKAWTRAEEDAAAGRCWKAQERLRGWIANHPYSPEAEALLGRIAWQMGDRWQAGRRWLLSEAEGEDVDTAVATYVAAFDGDVAAALAQLPGKPRSAPTRDLPRAAILRLQQLGMAALGPDLTAEGKEPRPAGMTLGARMASHGCLLLIVAGALLLAAAAFGFAATGIRLLVDAFR